ncbi:Alpha-mannosidase 2 [Nymphon striatum]|nr:Alpha-mannosidase 2 [Nymphon striatum]
MPATYKGRLGRDRLFEIVSGRSRHTDHSAYERYSCTGHCITCDTHLGHICADNSPWSLDADPSKCFSQNRHQDQDQNYQSECDTTARMVIQRTHFGWKEFLAERKWLDFKWPQHWKSSKYDNGITCHMAPFDLYSIKHSCGPFPETCLDFDFKQIPGQFSERFPIQINAHNIQERAELLVEQYGRVGSLFPHNVAMISLGDDFRFSHKMEWEQQYTNYNKLFSYINSRTDLHVDVRFGTVADYFKEVDYRMKNNNEKLPTLVGDFFPYGDVYAE